MSFNVVIPARYASTRLPGKPLADLGGRPMVVHVAERASRSGAAEVIVATDDQRICDAVTGAGHRAVMTAPSHPSGSDRVDEVARLRGWPDEAIVVNVQGDEPLIPPEVIDQVAECLRGDTAVQVATLCAPLDQPAEFDDPNVVKVVRAANGRALYFSRAGIPYPRDGQHAAQPWRHIGIYGYRVGALRTFVNLPPSPLETTEKLEQLRLLENGLSIRVEPAAVSIPPGVDTPQDLDRVAAFLAGC